MAEPERGGLPDPGDLVVVAGAGITGLPVIRFLAARGARVVVTSDRPAPAALADIPGEVSFAGDLQQVPDGTRLVVMSAGIPPHRPLPAAAVAAGVPVVGEVQLAWWIDRCRPDGGRPWLVVTGTNGKTTAVGMLEAMLRAAGKTVTACGNIGWPVLDAVLAGTHGSDADSEQDVIAVELSSFQLHYAPDIRPTAGLLLNLAQDHLEWHGSMAHYAAAKAVALTGDIAVAVIDDAGAAALLTIAPAARRIGVTAGVPGEGQIGVGAVDTGAVDTGAVDTGAVDAGAGAGGPHTTGTVLDRAFGRGPLFEVSDLTVPGVHQVTNAAAAAALALAVGTPPAAIRSALRAFRPAAHRDQLIAEIAGVSWIDDSKATNPHAAFASLTARPAVVWIAGGQLKGASVDALVVAVADRLVGVVVLGVDAALVVQALARHAPDVPRIVVARTDDGAMDEVVRAARTMAAPGTVVVLAPAAASLDMFASYGARGDAFARSVRAGQAQL